jgi:endonuclease/exonuclease/phosphatase family metal-dependent hydrolase
MQQEGFRVATYNVNKFDMKDPRSIVAVLQDQHIDICGLQEVPGKQALVKLLQHTQFDCVYLGPYFTYGLGLVYDKNIFHCVASQLHLLKDGTNKKAALQVTLTLLDKSERTLTLLVTHLDHRTEPNRLTELSMLLKFATNLSATPHLLMGDFNALKRSDYTDADWNEIARVRRESNWEAPYVDVIENIEKAGYVDLLATHQQSIIPTSRFKTRVDYIFASNGITTDQSSVIVSDLNQSDHKPVVTTIKI